MKNRFFNSNTIKSEEMQAFYVQDEATQRIKIKNTLKETEEQRIKNLSKKPLTIEEKIIKEFSESE